MSMKEMIKEIEKQTEKIKAMNDDFQEEIRYLETIDIEHMERGWK